MGAPGVVCAPCTGHWTRHCERALKEEGTERRALKESTGALNGGTGFGVRTMQSSRSAETLTQASCPCAAARGESGHLRRTI